MRPNDECVEVLASRRHLTSLGLLTSAVALRSGVFQLKRQTRRDRMWARLRALKEELQRRMHEPIPRQGKWLVRGYFAYHAVPTNGKSMSTFGHYVMDLWRRALQRRSQRTVLHGRGSLNLPRSSYLQSLSFILGRASASPSNIQGGSPVRESCTPGSVRGVLSNGHSYRDRTSILLRKDSAHGRTTDL